jgi:hypothetical protein
MLVARRSITYPVNRANQHDLTLRSERRERLEGWQQTRCVLPPFETPRFARLLRVR